MDGSEVSVGTPDDGSASFDDYFRSTSQPLVAMAYLLTGDRQVAQDLAQEAFLRTWSRWHRVRTYDNPGAWTRRVLYHLVVSNARRDRVRRRPLPVPTAVSPPEESHLLLAAVLRTLPRDQMIAIVLHDGAGMSVGEVALDMEVPEGTVKSWLSRGRADAASRLGPSSNGKDGHGD